MRRLIVNADDFGFAVGVTEGILEAHVAGIVTSTSLMVDEPAAEHAAGLARDHPALSIGLHFVDDGPELDQPDHAAREFARQLGRFRDLMGSDPTHVDSHHHVHMTRLSTFAPLVEPLGVPLRGDGRVKYLGAYFAHPRPGVVDLERVRAPFLMDLIAGETTARLHGAGLPPRKGDGRSELELHARTGDRARNPHRAGPAGEGRGARRLVGQLPRLARLERLHGGLGRHLLELEPGTEADAQDRAAVGRVGGLGEAVMRLGGLAHDRETQP